ncbi:uncharacterized protein SOCEGT47_054430 [Sorangium cellulosum]|uniref:Uncharacterized protein n=1 Tax=Sorangium cellulosum TaxID=56 RepID=A0A4P2Q7B2_SORCE|nr:uncharacterized protein SOCEGT47_054430 [Sorangium cellulosum]
MRTRSVSCCAAGGYSLSRAATAGSSDTAHDGRSMSTKTQRAARRAAPCSAGASGGVHHAPLASDGVRSPLPASGCARSPLLASGCARSPLPASGCARSPLLASGCARSPLPASGCARSPLPASGCARSPLLVPVRLHGRPSAPLGVRLAGLARGRAGPSVRGWQPWRRSRRGCSRRDHSVAGTPRGRSSFAIQTVLTFTNSRRP